MREDMLSELVKRAVLSPSYMKAAWARELENLQSFGLTTDQMMMASLSPTSNSQAFLAGSFNYPVIPGDESRCVVLHSLLLVTLWAGTTSASCTSCRPAGANSTKSG